MPPQLSRRFLNTRRRIRYIRSGLKRWGNINHVALFRKEVEQATSGTLEMRDTLVAVSLFQKGVKETVWLVTPTYLRYFEYTIFKSGEVALTYQQTWEFKNPALFRVMSVAINQIYRPKFIR